MAAMAAMAAMAPPRPCCSSGSRALASPLSTQQRSADRLDRRTALSALSRDGQASRSALWSGRRRASRGSGARRALTARAEVAAERYEVELEKPIGLKFYKGVDNCVYVDGIAPGQMAAQSGKFSVGDKVLETSAVFGDELWPAAEYGRTMYAIRQRAGTLVMRMEKSNGKMVEKFEAASGYISERNAGNVGDAIREKQVENYLKGLELKKARTVEVTEGLRLYKEGRHEEALIRFETLLGLSPGKREEAVANYNIACCFSKMGQVKAGLAALELALEAGFEDYKAIREDPDLASLRESDDFLSLINRYDEPFLNENALKALGSVFSFFKKK